MGNVYQPGLLQARPQFKVDPDTGDHYENVLWWKSASTTTPTAANLTAIANVFDGFWANVFANCANVNYTYLGSIWTDWSSNTGQQITTVGTFSPVTGDLTGGALPNQVAVLISYSTAQRYKGGHPRSYIPWVDKNAQSTSDPSQIRSTVKSAMDSELASLYPAMLASGVLGGQEAVSYRFRTNALKAEIVVINGYATQFTLATQRRRLRKVAHR